MLKKWYIVAFVLFVTLLGISTQQQAVAPNQEIVIQFDDFNITSLEVKNAIANVKKQLESFSVGNIQVKEGENRTLKITYYTEVDFLEIKNSFSKSKDLDIDVNAHNQEKGSKEFPLDDTNVTYNLNVYEIQNGQDSNWDFNGISIQNIDAKSNRFLDPNTTFLLNNFEFGKDQHEAKLALKLYKNIAIAIDDILHKIPEVRAGPIC